MSVLPFEPKPDSPRKIRTLSSTLLKWQRNDPRKMEPENDKARVGSARKLARDLIKRCKIKEPPVSLRTIIGLLQTTHDLSVYPSGNFSDRLSAILVTVEDESASTRRDEIHFNGNHSWHRRRFSI